MWSSMKAFFRQQTAISIRNIYDLHDTTATHLMFVNLPSSSIYPMQQIQNEAVKLIMNKHWLDSPTIIMRQLHWLPIRFRCEYKILLHVYRCMIYKQVVRNRECVFKKYKSKSTWMALKAERHKLHNTIYLVKKDHISDLVAGYGNDSGKLYKLVNNLTGCKSGCKKQGVCV